MAEEKLKLILEADPAAAVAGTKAAEAAVEDLGKAGTDAGKLIEDGLDKGTVALKDVGAEIAKLRPGLGEVGKAAQEAGVAFLRLSQGGDSIRGVIKNAAAAQVSLDQLKAAAEKARAAGEKMPEGFNDGLKKMQAEIDRAVTKARVLADAQGDLKSKGDAAAKGFESLTGAAGSLEGMLGKLKDTSGKSGQAIADFGFKGIALVSAFTLGYEKGTEFNTFLEKHGISLSAAIEKWKTFTGAADAGGNLFLALPTKINPTIAALRAHEKALADNVTALGKLGVAYKSDADAKADVEKKLRAMIGVLKEGEKAHRDFESSLDPKAILDLADAAAKEGIEIDKLDPIFARAIDAAAKMTIEDDKLVGAKQRVAEAAKKEAEAIAAAAVEAEKAYQIFSAPAPTQSFIASPEQMASIDAILAKYRALEEQVNRTREAMNKQTQTFDAAGRTAQGFGQHMETLAGGFKAVGDELVTTTILHTEWTQASEQSVVALNKWIEGLGREAEAMKKSLDAYPRAIDQLANLKAEYEQGSLSLSGMLRVLQMTIDQLSAMASRAAPKAREELLKLIETYEKFKLEALNGPIPAGAAQQMHDKGF